VTSPLCIHLSGDPDSCHAAATGLHTVSTAVYDDGERSIGAARSQSESDWQGGANSAGERFRESLTNMSDGAKDLSTSIETLSKALTTFADDLTTIKTRLGQARTTAEQGGLQTNDDWILGPDAHASDADRARQTGAYKAASSLVQDARNLEKGAHTALDAAAAAAVGEEEKFEAEKYWLAADTVDRTIETAVDQAKKWTEAAEERSKYLTDLKAGIQHAKDIGVPFPDDMAEQAVKNGEQAAEQSERTMTANAGLVLNQQDSKVANAFTRNMADDFPKLLPKGSTVAALAEKVPYLGAAITAGQTIYDVADGANHGDIPKTVTKDVGGAVVGTAVTSTILAAAPEAWAASWGGGPVTAAAVGVGIVASLGVGWAVDHWW